MFLGEVNVQVLSVVENQKQILLYTWPEVGLLSHGAELCGLLLL